MVKKIIWPLLAQTQLAKIYRYILKISYQNAEQVKADILASTAKLSANPEIHPADKYKKYNDGSFRAYELYHYRIAYRITEEEIIIVRVRHTAMEPKDY